MGYRAFKFETTISSTGKIELNVPIEPGTHVEVVILSPVDDFADLLTASQSSTAFWDNPLDDEDWNDA